MNRYRPYRSTLKSRALGNQRAANQQRDISQVVLKTTITRAGGQTLTLINNNNPLDSDNWKDTGTIALNIYDVLLRCEFYENYSNMYDQVRIDGVKVNVTPTSWTTSRDESPVPGYTIPKSLTLVTAWDRSGLDEEQFIKDPNQNNIYYCTIGQEIETYSSAVTKHLGPGSMFNIQRYLYPSSQQEKNQFVNTNDLKRQLGQTITEPYYYELAYDSTFDPSCPNNPISNPSTLFKPTFLLSVRSPYKCFTAPSNTFYDGPITEIIGWNKLKPTVFTLEFEITVTFRGLRYEKII